MVINIALRYKKLVIIVILLFVHKVLSFSQNEEVDSLYRLMEKADVKEKLDLFHQIHTLTFSCDPESSLEIVNQAINLAVNTNNTKNLIRLYQDKSACFILMNEYDSALLYVSKGKRIAQKLKEKLGIASCTELQGTISWYKSDFKKAQGYYIESLKVFEKIGDSIRIFNAYLNMGLLDYSIGEYKKATKYYWQAYEIIDTALYPNYAAVCLNNIGLIYQEWGDRTKALSYYLKALGFNRKINNNKRNISLNLDNIGKIFLDEGNYTKALDYYRQSLSLSIEIESQYGIGFSYISLCSVFEKLLQPDTVFFYAGKASEIFTEIKNEEGLAQVYFYRGEGYFIRKDYRNSINEYKKCADLSRKINDKAALSGALSGLGISFYRQGNFNKALVYLLESASLAEENNTVFLMLENYKYIADSYNKLDAKTGEIEFLRKYISLKDSVFTLEKEKMASELLVKYEVAKTEAELEIQTKEKIINRNKFVRQRIMTLAVGIVLLLSVFIVLLVYKRYRQKQKTNDLLRKHSIEIKQKQKEIEKQNIKLEEQAKSLKETDKLKSRFFSNISHEFRTPLSLIIGPLESLIPKTKNKQLKHQLNLILRSAHKLSGLINQILDLSKIDKGSLTVKLQYGNINKEVGFIAELFASYARERNLELIFEQAANEIYCYFDKEKLEKILNNLISNAIKNTNKGKIKVAINSKEKEIILIVGDTGKGIAKEDLPYIFDRFYMVESNNSPDYVGSGIGLAFTKELVQLLKGDIRVVSEIDKGSIFTVKLPIDKAVFNNNEYLIIDEDTTSHTTGHIELVSGLIGHGTDIGQNPKSLETVLVVEDHKELRGFICNSLLDKYRVLQAENGEEGIEEAVKNQPDIIITDIAMPKIDGIELTKTLKNSEETSHIPIIILTAKASRESKIIGLRTRADDYLSKPFNMEELKIRIDNLLRIRQKLREKYIRSIEVNPSEITTNSIDERLIARVLKVVEENMSNSDFSVEMLCEILGISRSYLHNKLKSLLNQSATEFINTIRVKRAAQLIRKNTGSISEIAYDVGFNSLSYFSKIFKKHFKTTPSEMQEEHC